MKKFLLVFFLIGCDYDEFSLFRESDSGTIESSSINEITTDNTSYADSFVSDSFSVETSEATVFDSTSVDVDAVYNDSSDSGVDSIDSGVPETNTCNSQACPMCPASAPFECCKTDSTCGCTWALQAICL